MFSRGLYFVDIVAIVITGTQHRRLKIMKATKLSPNQQIVYNEMLIKGGRSAHAECRTMKALEKKGLVFLVNANLGTWKVVKP